MDERGCIRQDIEDKETRRNTSFSANAFHRTSYGSAYHVKIRPAASPSWHFNLCWCSGSWCNCTAGVAGLGVVACVVS